eukprot:203107-Chlamydomonas_euryale.AAC.2
MVARQHATPVEPHVAHARHEAVHEALIARHAHQHRLELVARQPRARAGRLRARRARVGCEAGGSAVGKTR